MAPGSLERVLTGLPVDKFAAGRLLTPSNAHEDAAVVTVPAGMALVQTLDFFTPIVNDPYSFGQVAAANALSDVYAMGGQPWCAMNIVCFPSKTLSTDILSAILQGGADKIAEAGAALAGGHSVEDVEIKYGLSVTGIIDPTSFASNTGLVPGLSLIVTKALGTGVLATAVKGEVDKHAEYEKLLYESASRLNKAPGKVIRELHLKAATDITGFGLGGHLLEMLQASNVSATIHAGSIPYLPHALELAEQGFVPQGSHANRKHREGEVVLAHGVNPYELDLIFDAQTSGGMILAVPNDKVRLALNILQDAGEVCAVIGETTAPESEVNSAEQRSELPCACSACGEGVAIGDSGKNAGQQKLYIHP